MSDSGYRNPSTGQPLPEGTPGLRVPDRMTSPNVRGAWPDIREILSANSIKDMLSMEDEKFLRRAYGVSQDAHKISIPFCTLAEDDPRRYPVPFEQLPMENYRREPMMMEFFAHQTMGAAIGHVGGLARADFS